MRRPTPALPSLVTVFALAISVLFPAPALASDGGRCHSAIVDSRIVLPDGTVRDAHRLRACVLRSHSPTLKLIRISVDGYPVHMVLSRYWNGARPTSANEAFFVFRRDAVGRLQLQGYAVPVEGFLRAYVMQPAREDRYEVTTSWELLAREADGAGPGTRRPGAWPAVAAR